MQTGRWPMTRAGTSRDTECLTDCFAAALAKQKRAVLLSGDPVQAS